MSAMQVFAWCGVILLGLMMMVNATFMLVSPRLWFGLPSWLRAYGSLTRRKYSSGWGAIQVRLTGGAILAIIGWAVYGVVAW